MLKIHAKAYRLFFTGQFTLFHATCNFINDNNLEGYKFVVISPDVLVDKYQGGTERRTRQLFDALFKVEKAVVLLEECDTLFQMLTEMQKGEGKNRKIIFLQCILLSHSHSPHRNTSHKNGRSYKGDRRNHLYCDNKWPRPSGTNCGKKVHSLFSRRHGNTDVVVLAITTDVVVLAHKKICCIARNSCSRVAHLSKSNK